MGYVLAGLILAYLVFYVVFNAVSPNETAKRLGYKHYVILSESMEPELNKGDLIMVTNKDFNNLKEGDIITFVNPNNKKDVVTHNFVCYDFAGTEKVARTKGNQSSDGGAPQLDIWEITKDDYIGVYRYHIPKIGNAVMYLQSWYGFVSIILICGVIAGTYFLINYLKEEKEDELVEEQEKE